MCVALAYVNSPQRCVSIIAFGTYGDVARCGWEVGIKSNGKQKILVSLRASVTSVAIDRQGIPTKQESQHV
ncbi:MAG: hypothetical protein K2N70_00340 [Helicobacter sp.]|nr:hypothetical protein [Helicobacter sp.]